ncbi:DUF2513 domain-containing protein [Pectobacterium actinidiae]|uniref:DUF2513 domain-containing protein n=1 Tax=Pectobacterium TaxID=122277 RepID=UPI0015E03292|nr:MULTISPECIES: DUF2513 domain-containing protein [Pectobacterium]MBA0188273.1 DUF2513 domain-containing protein [Pectobacterium odoriferum]WEF10311.1 DUF2513 domain-containing protein [Pectobacterium actinidiae]
MRTDLDYLKGMLSVFLDAETAFISTGELEAAGYEITSDKGMFHYMQLIEQGYISNKSMVTHSPDKLGYSYHIGGMRGMKVDVRLTTSGIEFASALESKDVFEKLKDIGSEPMSVLKDVGVELLKSYAKKKFGLSE